MARCRFGPWIEVPEHHLTGEEAVHVDSLRSGQSTTPHSRSDSTHPEHPSALLFHAIQRSHGPLSPLTPRAMATLLRELIPALPTILEQLPPPKIDGEHLWEAVDVVAVFIVQDAFVELEKEGVAGAVDDGADGG